MHARRQRGLTYGILRWRVEIWPVENVVQLPTELPPGAFCHGKVLGEHSVPSCRTGSRQNVARRVPIETPAVFGLHKSGGVKNRKTGLDSVAHAAGVSADGQADRIVGRMLSVLFLSVCQRPVQKSPVPFKRLPRSGMQVAARAPPAVEQ